MGPPFLQCSCTGSAAAVLLHPLIVFAVQEGREKCVCVCVCVWYKTLEIAPSLSQSSGVGKGSQASCSSGALGQLWPLEQAGPWAPLGAARDALWKAEGKPGPAGEQCSEACARALASKCHWAEASSRSYCFSGTSQNVDRHL